jgi:hypothetical protein
MARSRATDQDSVYIDSGTKKASAYTLNWPGWCPAQARCMTERMVVRVGSSNVDVTAGDGSLPHERQMGTELISPIVSAQPHRQPQGPSGLVSRARDHEHDHAVAVISVHPGCVP